MRISIICLLLLSLLLAGNVHATSITLPNGQVLKIDNLTDEEVKKAISLSRKSINKQAATDMINNVSKLNPNELDQWRKLITGTIKDICNDLNIAVNDFVKTPVGAGIAALIVYKIAGQDFISHSIRFIIMIPLWFMVSSVCLYLSWYFTSIKTVYKNDYDSSGKLKSKSPIRIARFDWDDRSYDKSTFFWTMFITWVIITALTLLICLV